MADYATVESFAVALVPLAGRLASRGMFPSWPVLLAGSLSPAGTRRRHGRGSWVTGTVNAAARPQHSTQVLSTHRPWDASTGSSDVNEPQINLDHFYHRPSTTWWAC